MAQFDYKGFLKEGGIEKYLLEEQFGNDIESRYNFIRPLMSRLPDSARTEAMIDGMEEAKAEDDKMAFDFYFVETMKMLGLEDELMEPGDDEPITPPGPEDMPGAKVSPFVTDKELANIFVREGDEDELTENDDVLDEMLDEAEFEVGDMVYRKSDGAQFPMKVVGVRKMFASPLHAITVIGTSGGDELEYDETQLVKLEEVEGEVQNENKVLKASNDLEDAINSVADELTDAQIDSITDMILDLRDKVKASLKEGEVLEEGRSIPIARRSISFKNLDILSTVRKNFDQYESIALVKDVMGGGKGKTGTLARITNFEEAIDNTDVPIEIEMVNGMDPKGVVVSMLYMIKKGDLNKVVDTLKKEHTTQIQDQQAKLDALNKL